MRSFDQLRESLLQTDDEFRQLAAQHQELDSRLSELSRQVYRSNSEELERGTLKKRKLYLKDQMESVLRRHRELTEANPLPALQQRG